MFSQWLIAALTLVLLATTWFDSRTVGEAAFANSDAAPRCSVAKRCRYVLIQFQEVAMSIIHRMTVRARHDRSNRLGQCLARLHEVGRDIPGCERLRVFPLGSDPLIWQVEGQWRSALVRDAFLSSEGLCRVLAQAMDEGLFTHLECGTELEQQVA